VLIFVSRKITCFTLIMKIDLRMAVDWQIEQISQFQITTNKMQRFLIYLFLQMLYMFQAVPLTIIRSAQL